jgi:hypothetical protein
MINLHDEHPDDPAYRIKTPQEMADELAADYMSGKWDNPVSGPYKP